MKITIAYTDKEQRDARMIESLILDLLPGVKIHRSDRHAPFLHTYMTTKKSDKDLTNGPS